MSQATIVVASALGVVADASPRSPDTQDILSHVFATDVLVFASR